MAKLEVETDGKTAPKKRPPPTTTEIAKKDDTGALLLHEAKINYTQMQRSWYLFAKSIWLIKTQMTSDGRYAFQAVAETFKEFCEKEYPSLDYPMMVKFVAIVDYWGDVIEGRIKKDETYQLPSYETCYKFSTVSKKIGSKEEISRIKKAILDNKITHNELRESFKDLIRSYRKTSEVSEEDIEKELTRDLAKDDLGEPEFDFGDDDDLEREVMAEPDEEEDEDVDVDEDHAKAKNGSVISLLARVDYLRDNLPALMSEMDEVTGEIVDLATSVESLIEVANSFLKKVEDLST
jgi:hypothetical protein